MGRPKKNPGAAPAPRKIHSLPGLKDIVASSDSLWALLLKRLSRLSRVYGFERVETPLLEDSRLYESFYKDAPVLRQSFIPAGLSKAGPAAVRPSFLPSVLRAYHQHKIYELSPLTKWSFSGFCATSEVGESFEANYEFGFEVFGQFNHLTEAQVLGAVWEFLQSVGMPDCVLEINSLGQRESQEVYSESLLGFLQGKKYQLCDACVEHLDGRVLNVFRCNNLDCQAVLSEAPAILDFLDEASRKHFTNILEALDELNIPYQLNPLYAGPSGFGKTNVVIKTKLKGQTVVLGEGGYHDQLLQTLSGKNFSCFGFSGSLCRVHEILEAAKTVVLSEQKNDVFLVPLGELAAKKSLRLFRDLTGEKISVHDHFGTVGVKNQLKAAETFHAPIALIMGQKEAMDEMVILRDVKSGMQEIISYDKIVQEVKKRLGR